MSNVREWQAKVKEQEHKRVGDIYDECVKRGCDLRYLKSVDTRAWLYPLRQTNVFLKLKTEKRDVSDHIEQWKILLEVLIKLRPEHEKIDDWKESLRLLETI